MHRWRSLSNLEAFAMKLIFLVIIIQYSLVIKLDISVINEGLFLKIIIKCLLHLRMMLSYTFHLAASMFTETSLCFLMALMVLEMVHSRNCFVLQHVRQEQFLVCYKLLTSYNNVATWSSANLIWQLRTGHYMIFFKAQATRFPPKAELLCKNFIEK